MLVSVIGSDNFRLGMRSFVKAYAMKNAKTKDLWNHIQTYAGDDVVDVTKFMATFTEQSGFPLVNVTREGKTLILTQSRFLDNSRDTYNCSDSDFGLVLTKMLC